MYVDTLLLSVDTPEKDIESHYRWLWAIMWLLGLELGTSGGAVSAPSRWAISPAPPATFKKLLNPWMKPDLANSCNASTRNVEAGG